MVFFLITFHTLTMFSAILVVGSFYRYRERDSITRVVGYIFLLSVVCQSLQFLTFLMGWPGAIINLVGTSYDFTYIVLIAIFFHHITSFKRKTFVTFASAAVFLWGIVNKLFIQDAGAATTFTKASISFMLIAFAILYFSQLMRELPTVHLHRLPSFWFNSAILIFGAGTIILMSSYDYVIRMGRSPIDLYYSTISHNILFILHQIIFLIGLSFDLKKSGAGRSVALGK
jgi:hypothetical protein